MRSLPFLAVLGRRDSRTRDDLADGDDARPLVVGAALANLGADLLESDLVAVAKKTQGQIREPVR